MKYCPITGTQGRTVDSATLKALLATSLRTITPQPYYFCDDADCNVVYFSDDQSHLIKTDELRVRVYQKEPTQADVPICYCFQHTVADVKNAPDASVENIKGGIKEDQCACDWRNPQGTCCLGNVQKLIKSL